MMQCLINQYLLFTVKLYNDKKADQIYACNIINLIFTILQLSY